MEIIFGLRGLLALSSIGIAFVTCIVASYNHHDDERSFMKSEFYSLCRDCELAIPPYGEFSSANNVRDLVSEKYLGLRTVSLFHLEVQSVVIYSFTDTLAFLH